MRVRGSGEAGFSLVEMAVVTVLIAIFLTLGLGALNVQQEGAAASTTQKNLDAIKEAFINYVREKKRLPCPDIEPISLVPPDGKENPIGGPCPANAAFGVLPYLDLGLTRETALDGWGNLYSYHVSVSITGGAWNWSNADSNWAPKGPFVSTGSKGALKVKDSSASPSDISNDVVAVVISHGRNGLGAYTTRGTRIDLPGVVDPSLVDEQENANADDTYVRRARADSGAGGAFDDYVMYVTANDLLGSLVKDGSVKWADVTNAEHLARIKDAAIGYAITQLKLPSAPVISQDPWGNSYEIVSGKLDYTTTGIGSGACDTLNAFTVQSQSPGQSLSVTCDELNGLLAKNGKA